MHKVNKSVLLQYYREVSGELFSGNYSSFAWYFYYDFVGITHLSHRMYFMFVAISPWWRFHQPHVNSRVSLCSCEMSARMWEHDYIIRFLLGVFILQCPTFARVLPMMTSSNGNILRVTGPLCGELFDAFFDLCLNKWLMNNREAGDLRRHRAHYDVTVMQSAAKRVDAPVTIMLVKLIFSS